MTATILLVSKPVAPPWNDATKNLVRDLAEHADAYRYHVLTRGDFRFGSKKVREEPLLSAHPGYRPPHWQELRVFLRLIKPDASALLHFFFTPNRASSRLCSLALAMNPRRPSVQTICSAPPAATPLKPLLFADANVAVSRATARRLQEEGVSARVIHPGVAEKPRPDADACAAVRRAAGLPLEVPLALYAGDLEFSDGVRTLIEAASYLGNPRLHIAVCSRNKTPGAVTARAAARRRVAELDLAARVSFLEPSADLQPLLAACDMLVLSPDTLQAKMDLPLVVLEAMAWGRPVIVSSLPSLMEAVADRDTGLVVPPSDPRALAFAMDALAEAEFAARLGRAARERARDEFGLDRMARAYEALYTELLR